MDKFGHLGWRCKQDGQVCTFWLARGGHKGQVWTFGLARGGLNEKKVYVNEGFLFQQVKCLK